MKKRKIIICGSVLAAFLMLSTIAFSPVSAQEMINPPQEKDSDLTQLTELTNSLTSSLESLSTNIAANDEINTLLEKIENNQEVQDLIEQIQNTDDEKQKQLLAEQLIELLYSLPEFEQIEGILGSSDFATQINDVNEDIEMLLTYIDSLSDDTNFDMESSESQNSLDSATSDTYLYDVAFVMSTACMMEYQYVYYPDEETDIPDPDNPDENLTYEELLDMIETGEISLGDFLTFIWLLDVVGCVTGMVLGIAMMLDGFTFWGATIVIMSLLFLDLLADIDLP